MNFLIIDCGSSKTSQIHDCLHSLGHNTENVDLKGLNDVRPNKYEGIIIGGSPTMLSEVETELLLDKFLFIQSIKKPVLGICFGHQLIGLLYGAEIQSGEEKKKDEVIKILKKDDPLFKGFAPEVLFNESHQEEINIPDNFVHLATSPSCENEAMKHPERKLYSVQFHPETSSENGLKFFQNFCDICAS